MTALKPIENRHVRGVAAERYPLNPKCAHPECTEPAVDPHHVFPRSLIGGDSWFVEITESVDGLDTPSGTSVLPHVAGLCRAHHDDVEEHRAWIKLEDGEFRWYDRHLGEDMDGQQREEWTLLGPLNPQPGSREGKAKRKKFQGAERRARKRLSVAVPQDEQEDGAGIWDDLIEQLEAKINPEEDKRRPPYYTIIDALNYTLLNAGGEDF